MLSANEIPRQGHSFPMKASHTLPTSCKLSVLSKNTPAYYELMFSNLKLQYCFIISQHFPLSMILFVMIFSFSLSFYCCFKTQIFATIFPCFSLALWEEILTVNGGTGCLFWTIVMFGLIHRREDSTLECQHVVKG